MREKENKEEKKSEKNRIKINKKIKHEKIIFFLSIYLGYIWILESMEERKKMLRKIFFS